MYKHRLRKVVEKMKELNIEAMIATSSDAIYYLTGARIHPGERLLALIIKSSQTATLFTNEMFKISNPLGEVVYFSDNDKPIARLYEEIKVLNRIGIDKEWPAHFLIDLMALGDFEVITGSSVIDNTRLIKDESEQVAMAKASALNDMAMARVFDLLKNVTISERATQAKIAEIFRELGADDISFTPIVCFGKGAAEPHHSCDETVLKEGSVIVDMGCIYQQYCSDMTRSFYRGIPSEKYQRAYQAVLEANQNAIAKVKPGVALADIDHVARTAIAKYGFGDFFIHRTGHGIGISVHEYPDVSATSQEVCKAGMVFSIEPGIYVENEFGIRIEDLVLVTEDGCCVLNQYDKSLQSV